MTCSKCGTENPTEQDVCLECGLPLTGSGDVAMRTELEQQNEEGLLNAREDATTMSTGQGLGGGPIVPPRLGS
jgi:uncharacterized membrane protein YvbJ